MFPSYASIRYRTRNANCTLKKPRAKASLTRLSRLSSEEKVAVQQLHWQFVETIRQGLGGSLTDLYKLQTSQILKHDDGSRFFARFNNSVASLVMTTYPLHCWQPWKFTRAPQHYWPTLAKQFFEGDPSAEAVVRIYIDEIADTHQVKRLEDWDHVLKIYEYSRPSESNLVYFGTLRNVLQILFPYHHWSFGSTAKDTVDLTVKYAHKLPTGYFKSEENRRQYMDFLKNMLGNTYEGLYAVQKRHFFQTGGGRLLLMHRGSPSEVVMSVYKEHQWEPWKFSRVSFEWWKKLAAKCRHGDAKALDTLKLYIRSLEREYNIKRFEDWGNVRLSDIHLSIITHFNSVEDMLSLVYPNHNWKKNRSKIFKGIGVHSKQFWDNPDNEKAYVEFLRKEVCDGTYESLYSITRRTIINTGGKLLLSKYDRSPAYMFMSICPEHKWCPWKFEYTPRGWWSLLAYGVSQNNESALSTLREFMEDLAQELGLTSLSEWTKIDQGTLSGRVRDTLLCFGGLENILRTLYPNKEWVFEKPHRLPVLQPYSSKLLPASHWTPHNIRHYFDFLKSQLGGTYDALYNLTYVHMVETGGATLARLCNNTVSLLVMFAYPEHGWRPWLFAKTPMGWWSAVSDWVNNNVPESIEVARLYVEHLAEILDVRTLADWYGVTRDQLNKVAPYSLELFGGISELLPKLYPIHPWEKNLLSSPNKKSIQHLMRKQLKALLPESQHIAAQ